MSHSGSDTLAGPEAYIGLSNVSLTLPVFVQDDRVVGSWASALARAVVQRPRREYRTLLEGISFEAFPGDRVALIGRNGAGKTTLLHVLTGAFTPSAGGFEVRGGRQALINMSLGFHPEATIRENILLRGAAMGVDIATLLELSESILAFAGLADVASERLATLSAGQRLRLGFSISTSVQHDIMLLDEWIGAGDAEFLSKARERMLARVEGSKIMVLASHSNDLLKRVCNRGLVVEKGRLEFDGPIEDALDFYKGLVRVPTSEATRPDLIPKAKAKALSLKHLGEAPLGFPHHVLFQNGTRAERQSSLNALIELIDTEPHEAIDALVGLAGAAGLTRIAFESVHPSLKLRMHDAEGNELVATVVSSALGDGAKVEGGRARVHLSSTSTRLDASGSSR